MTQRTQLQLHPPIISPAPKMNIIEISYLVYMLLGIYREANASGTGPYDVVTDRISDCSDTKSTGLKHKLNLKKTNKPSTLLEGDIHIKQVVDNGIDVTITVAQLTKRGTWKENFLNRDFGEACNVMNLFVKDFAGQLAQKMGLKRTCPLPVGNYTVANLPFELSVPQIPVFAYGRYRVKAVLAKGKKSFGCIQLIGDAVPKTSKMG